jgi:hypothetical protein
MQLTSSPSELNLAIGDDPLFVYSLDLQPVVFQLEPVPIPLRPRCSLLTLNLTIFPVRVLPIPNGNKMYICRFGLAARPSRFISIHCAWRDETSVPRCGAFGVARNLVPYESSKDLRILFLHLYSSSPD